jgi:hypothetical protein
VKLRQAWRVLRILHIALLASLGVYAAIAVFIANQPVTTPTGSAAKAPLDPQLLTSVLGAMAALTLVAVIPFMRKLLMPKRQRVGDGRDLDLDEAVTGPLNFAFGRLRVGCIVTWALCESIAIYGLMLAILFHDARYYGPFAGVAAVAMLVFAPRRALIEEVVRGARAG